MQANSIKIESDEDGFHLIMDVEPGTWLAQTHLDINIHGCAEALHEQVNLIIGGWLAEGERARREFRCNPDESGGYVLSNPKCPDFHSVHADLYDNREKV